MSSNVLAPTTPRNAPKANPILCPTFFIKNPAGIVDSVADANNTPSGIVDSVVFPVKYFAAKMVVAMCVYVAFEI
jgi:hypothetical protein